MKKNTVRWWIVLAIVMGVYNVVVFVIPFEKTAVFFLSWIFTLVAIGAQAYVIHVAFYQGEGAKSKFYGFPITRIGVIYLVAQLMLGLAFMVFGFAVVVPMWIPLVLYVLLLGATAIGFVAADAARDEVILQDAKQVKNTSRMWTMQLKVSSIVGQVQGEDAVAALKQFSEYLRFSDPVSNDTLLGIETELVACINDIQIAVIDGDNERILRLCQKANVFLAERNKLCKLSK